MTQEKCNVMIRDIHTSNVTRIKDKSHLYSSQFVCLVVVVVYLISGTELSAQETKACIQRENKHQTDSHLCKFLFN